MIPRKREKSALDEEQGAGGDFRTQGMNRSSEFEIHDADPFSLQPLSKLRFTLDSATMADIMEAGNAIWDWNQLETSIDRDVYAKAFMNIEALSSVHMDGKLPSADDIFYDEAEASFSEGTSLDHLIRYQRDKRSIQLALDCAEQKCSVQFFRDIHKKVLPPKHLSTGGHLRADLKQSGGSRYHMFGHAYTMPEPEDIEPLLDDLARFMNDTGIPVIEQAAIAHAQLVNIHPFERGNGKMARLMVNTVLRHRGASPYYLLPITPIVVTSNHDYVAGIDACKLDGSEDRDRVDDSLNAWLSYFAMCCRKAVELAVNFISECETIHERQLSSMKLRKGSSAYRLVGALPAMPVFTANMVAEQLGCSFKSASEGLKALADSGAIELLGNAKRNRIYSSPEVLDAYLRIDALS